MKINTFITESIRFIIPLLLSSTVFAGSPIFTFTPSTLTTFNATSIIGTATVRYTLTNESSSPSTLIMAPIAGITQVTTAGNCPSPFVLGSKQSCPLTLLVDGNHLTSSVQSGPKVCQLGADGKPSSLLCYQPNTVNSLNITVLSPAQYTVVPSAGANGSISPSAKQTITSGSNITFTATPNANYPVGQWIVDGRVVQTGGTTYTLSNVTNSHLITVSFTPVGTLYTVTPSAGANGSIAASTPQTVNRGNSITFVATPNAGALVNQWLVDGVAAQTGGTTYTVANVTANHSVAVSFTPSGTLYAGMANGNVYYSTNNGLVWNATTIPAPGQVVNSVFATVSTLYAGSADSHVYFSTNNGVSWTRTSASPDASSVNSVFVTLPNIIYIGTAGGHVYRSFNNGVTWIATLNPPTAGIAVKSLYIVPGVVLYAGSADGNVYYSTDGMTWTAINGVADGSAIHSVYVTNSRLYINTANEYAYSSTSLNGGGSWQIYAQTVYSLFANLSGSIIDAGTQSGYVFSLSTGNELGFVAYSPVNSVFFLG